ncbi:MAG: hypothetical protein ACOYXR_03410 [Nitrospirota bacterium]
MFPWLSQLVGMTLAAVAAVGFAGEQSAAQAASIYRGFHSLQLGMTIEEFTANTPAEEVSRNPASRVFAVTRVPSDIYGVTASFDGDRLAHIEVIYSSAYSARTSWQTFVDVATGKYGTGFHLPTPGGDVEMWDDGQTTLILERRAVTDEATAYTLTLQDDAAALKRNSRCAPRMDI